MRPVQFDIVGLAGHIARADPEAGTEARLERLVGPIGCRYRQWGYQRPIFEIAGARLQIHQRSADLEVMPRVRRLDDDGLADVSRGRHIRRGGQGFRILQPPRLRLQAPRRVASAPPWTLRDELTRARNAAFSFSRASSRAEICSSSVAADAGCRTAAAANARQRSKANFVNLVIVRTPQDIQSVNFTSGR